MEPKALNRPFFVCASFILLAVGLSTGCSDSSSDSTTAAPANDIDTSYLDDLAASKEPEPADKPIIQTEEEPVEGEQASVPEDEEREWHKERGSQSTLGKTRDRARDLTNRIKDGTAPAGGIADTYSDEEYASTSGYRWEMPEDWRMAVPAGDRFAEMYIKNQLGNASVSFSKESGSVQQITRDLASILVTDSGGPNRAKTETKTILGIPVTIVDMNGTYIDQSSKGGRNESPFYAMHAAIFELPNTRVLINMWGPEDTIERSIGKFNAMIEQMTKE